MEKDGVTGKGKGEKEELPMLNPMPMLRRR
jgi:hypothetical protein